MKTQHPAIIIPNFSCRLTSTSRIIAERLANRIDELLTHLGEGEDLSEIYGLFGMATMMNAHSEGELSDVQIYNFMSKMAIQKTPSPVQKTETNLTLDIKETVRSLMSENVVAFRETKELADKRREEIKERLKTDNRLVLLREEKEDSIREEPEEIKRLRGGK